MLASWKVPFMKHPCKKGRCITSMICNQENYECAIYVAYDDKIDKCMEHMRGDTFMELSFFNKIEGVIFMFMMCCAYPRHAIKEIFSSVGNKLIEWEQKIKDDY